MLETIREAWGHVPIAVRFVGGLFLFWGAVYFLYGRKSVY
jgi:hypothetical protein